MDLVSLLILLIVIGLVLWAVQRIPMPEPLNWVVPVIVALVLIAWLLGGGHGLVIR